MHRLTQLGQIILIGLSSILLGGCPFENFPDKHYKVSIRNQTQDTLLISIFEGGRLRYVEVSIIPPDYLNKDIVYYENFNFGIKGSENPASVMFQELSGKDSCWVYKMDDSLREFFNDNRENPSLLTPPRSSIVKVWEGPFRELVTHNHFFNKSSWEVIHFPIDSVKWVDGVIQFTITDKDLE